MQAYCMECCTKREMKEWLKKMPKIIHKSSGGGKNNSRHQDNNQQVQRYKPVPILVPHRRVSIAPALLMISTAVGKITVDISPPG